MLTPSFSPGTLTSPLSLIIVLRIVPAQNRQRSHTHHKYTKILSNDAHLRHYLYLLEHSSLASSSKYDATMHRVGSPSYRLHKEPHHTDSHRLYSQC